jgi:hypothetical protein
MKMEMQIPVSERTKHFMRQAIERNKRRGMSDEESLRLAMLQARAKGVRVDLPPHVRRAEKGGYR